MPVSDAQKRAIRKYYNTHKDKVKELARIRYEKKAVLKKEELLKKLSEEKKINVLLQLEEERKMLYSYTYITGLLCKVCHSYLPPMSMNEHLDPDNPKNKCKKCDDDNNPPISICNKM